jgi:cystathionine beta-lyase/cystathionine gamma-synthase
MPAHNHLHHHAQCAPALPPHDHVHKGHATPDHPYPVSYVPVTRARHSNNNPSQLAVAAKMAALEGAESALVTASGMAAISAVLYALLKAGDHILVQVGAWLACSLG